MDISIRDYVDADWPAVCRIHDAARPLELAGVAMDGPPATMAEAAEGDGFFASQSFVAETEDGRIVGFASIIPPELTWLYVDPAAHRQGVGRALMAHVVPMLGKDGFVYLVGSNLPARALYESFGFTLTSEVPGECEGNPCTGLRLCLPESVHRERPPEVSNYALKLNGYPENTTGAVVRDADGVWRWEENVATD